MEYEAEKLGTVIAPIGWKFHPVINLTHIEALPPAAKEREIKKEADRFASTGRNVFVHYTIPILEERRKRLLASGLRKKKYQKTAPQLYQVIGADEEFYWNEVARQLRQEMKQGTLSPKGCLIHGGRANEQRTYVWHAEIAVAAYLELPAPAEKVQDGESDERDELISGISGKTEEYLVAKVAAIDLCKASTNGEPPTEAAAAADNERLEKYELLDTLPDRFECEQKMLYSHFTHYDYAVVRAAEGKHQTAMLRQLADLFDKTGKTLFYYYAVPRLCKEMYPPTDGTTVTGQAADVWRFFPDREKEKWCSASAEVKKKLGDGNLSGLEVLELGSLDPEVLRLHEVALSALRAHKAAK